MQLLNRYAIAQRRFPDWSMAFSSYPSLYVQGMIGFFPIDEHGESPMTTLCRELTLAGAAGRSSGS